MERVDGPSLDAFVREQRSLPLRMILKMAMQIADALDYAHRQGIVHQDIKLENIICTSDSGNVKRSEEHTSELQSLMRISYAVFCLKKKNKRNYTQTVHQ